VRVSLIILLLLSGCAKTHTVNICGGIDIPVCKHSYEPTPIETIEDQEKKLKQSMLRVMTLMLDQMTQTLLKSMAP